MEKTYKILFMSANPEDSTKLKVTKECNLIEDSILRANLRDRFDIRQRHDISTKDFLPILLYHQPQILHFSGHGSKDSSLIFINDDGTKKKISPIVLEEIFKNFSDKIDLVFLNACYSKEQAI